MLSVIFGLICGLALGAVISIVFVFILIGNKIYR